VAEAVLCLEDQVLPEVEEDSTEAVDLEVEAALVSLL
jgi:hypothetical protein